MDVSSDAGRRRRTGISGLVTGPVGDVADLLGALPEIARLLRGIHDHTVHMDAEVTGMHAAVERLAVEVLGLRGDIGTLTAGIGSVVESVGRLEPQIADLNMVARPIHRVRHRLAGHHPREPAVAAAELASAAAELAAAAAELDRSTAEPQAAGGPGDATDDGAARA